MNEAPSKPAKSVAVELLKPHTHEGVLREPGDKIDLSESQAAWLISLQVAKTA
jgi:hypothetical protein